MIYQYEVCPETSRVHAQGYVQFTKQLTRNQVKKYFDSTTIHLEPRKGSHEEAVAYCSKEDTRLEGEESGPFIYGTPSIQGERKDLKKLHSAVLSTINDKTTIRRFALENPSLYVRNHNGIDKLIAYHQQSRNFKTKVLIYWGDSGTGKTRDAMSLFPNSTFSKPCGQWWDNYMNHEVVVIDDYDGSMPFVELLKLMDRYEMFLPKKGGFVNFNSKYLIFTSNIDPQLWYKNLTKQQKVAFSRRVEECYHYVNGQEPKLDNNFFNRPAYEDEDDEDGLVDSPVPFTPIPTPEPQHREDNLHCPPLCPVALSLAIS